MCAALSGRRMGPTPEIREQLVLSDQGCVIWKGLQGCTSERQLGASDCVTWSAWGAHFRTMAVTGGSHLL
jgi:hypothetical protein